MVAQFIATRPILDLCEKAARRAGVSAVVGTYGDRPEGSAREGGGRSGGNGNGRGFGVRGRAGGGRGRKRGGGGVPGSERVQWSGAEDDLTSTFVGQGSTEGTNT